MTNLSLAISLLKDGQHLKITPHGTSMTPFFCGDRDSVLAVKPVFPLKRGDIAVFLRTDGTYVIHRVYAIKKTADNYQYYFLGDNQSHIEGPISEAQIHAQVAYIIRKGKQIDCKKSIPYRILSHIWMLLRPVRLPILAIVRRFKKKLSRK